MDGDSGINAIGQDDVFVAEKISKKRFNKGRDEFFVKWKGWSRRYSTWEPRENILDDSLIQMFELEELETVANGGQKKRGRKPKRLKIHLSQQLGEKELSNTPSDVDISPLNLDRKIHNTSSHRASDGETSQITQLSVISKKITPSTSRRNHRVVYSSDDETDDSAVCESQNLRQMTKKSNCDKQHDEVHHSTADKHIGHKPKNFSLSRNKFKSRAYKHNRFSKPGKGKLPYLVPKTNAIRTLRRPGRPRKIPLSTEIINHECAQVNSETKPEINTRTYDPNWSKNEIVITDINANSTVVTFTECQTKECIFT